MESRNGLTPLAEEVALRLLGYRWVEWDRNRPDGGPSDETGRFLAHPEGLLSRFQTPVGRQTPLALEPDRNLPLFLEDPGAAFEVAMRAGLFRDSGVLLSMSPQGEWTLRTAQDGVVVSGKELAEVLCRASLAWADSLEAG